MWRETTKHERNLRIFAEKFDGFLPPAILDFHVHVWNAGVAPPGALFNSGGCPIKHYDFDDLGQDLREAFPGRETAAVCFGLPDVSYDLKANNEYIAGHCDNETYFGLRLFDPQADTPESLRRDLEQGNYLGLKPYPVYARASDDATEIRHMLPDWALEIVNDLHLMVMLHIPRRRRLADPLNQEQLVRICTRYPNANIILAHIGRAYFLKNVVGNLDALRGFSNLYYDLTMLNHWEVMEYTFTKVRPERILFGSDIPIALAPGKSVEINDQYTYVTPRPWALSISDDHGKLEFTSFLYEELRAIQKAVQRLGLGDDFVQGVFHGNGMQLLKETLAHRPASSLRKPQETPSR